jgi:hypothetical protein
MSKKGALIHKLDSLKQKHPREFEDVGVENVEFFLDIDTEPEEILQIIDNFKNHFKLIIRTILLNQNNSELYKCESDNVYAMRFKNKTANSRIYCQEQHIKGEKRKIIMSRGLSNKTSQKNNKTNLPIIESVKKESYTFLYSKEDEERHKKNKKSK